MKPSCPVPTFRNASETPVVIFASRIKKCRKVKKWCRKNVSLTQFDCDEQAAHAAITVQKWVDRFELIVCKRSMNERWKHLVVKEPLPPGEVVP